MASRLTTTRLDVSKERYQLLTPLEAVAHIAAGEAKHFTVLDAMKLYHQCLLNVFLSQCVGGSKEKTGHMVVKAQL